MYESDLSSTSSSSSSSGIRGGYDMNWNTPSSTSSVSPLPLPLPLALPLPVTLPHPHPAQHQLHQQMQLPHHSSLLYNTQNDSMYDGNGGGGGGSNGGNSASGGNTSHNHTHNNHLNYCRCVECYEYLDNYYPQVDNPRIKVESADMMSGMGMGMGMMGMDRAVNASVRPGEEVYMDGNHTSSSSNNGTEADEEYRYSTGPSRRHSTPHDQLQLQPTPQPSPQLAYHHQRKQARHSRGRPRGIPAKRKHSTASISTITTSSTSMSTPPSPSSHPHNSPSTPPRSPSNAISRLEMEMLYDRITAVAHKEWGAIVKEINAHFGHKRRPDNVRTHWNTIAKQKLLAGYR